MRAKRGRVPRANSKWRRADDLPAMAPSQRFELAVAERVAALANIAGRSSFHFTRMFTRSVGISPSPLHHPSLVAAGE
jgi:AraC-like DNA-binding protein